METRDCLPRDPGPALTGLRASKSLEQAGSDPFHLLLGLMFLSPCPQGPSGLCKLQLAILSSLLVTITTLLDYPPPQRVRNNHVGVIPFQLRGLRTPRHTSFGCLSHRPTHTPSHTIRCAHRLKLSFISKLSLMLWLNTPSVYPGYIEKPPKHSKTFPVAVASKYECVCLCV